MLLTRRISGHLAPFALLSFMCALIASPAARAQTLTVEALVLAEQALREEVPLVGTVSSQRMSLLSPEVEGLVKVLHVDVGDQVAAGQPLLVLDDELRRVERDRLEAELTRARAQWQDAQRRATEGQTLSSAIAASEVRTLEAQQEIAGAESRVAEADLRRLDAMLERHVLRAPFAGIITAKLSEEGQWVTPGTTVLELVDTDTLYLDFQVSQRYFGRIGEQSQVALGFESYPGQAFVGEVYRKVPLSQAGARTFLLRVALPEVDQRLLIPGMSVSGVLQVDASKSGLAVPRDALIRYPDGRTTVWLASDGEWDGSATVREQRVDLGRSHDGLVEILYGLTAGDRVIVRGNEALLDGQTVLLRRASAGN